MVRDIFQTQIEKSITPATVKTLTSQISAYVDRNSEILLSLDLSQRYSFGDSDRQIVYQTLGITEDQLEQAIKASKFINKSNKIQSNTFYVACILLMHFLLKKKYEKEAKLVMSYMSLMMYTSIHKGFFKYNINKQIMDYTIAHLDQSFSIRTSSSLFDFLQTNAMTTFDTYQSRIVKCDDRDITYVTDALWVRIKQKIRKIANAAYTNYQQGNYLNSDQDSYVEGDYHEIDNNAFVIERLVNKIYLRLLNHQYDDRFIKYAITRSDTSYQKLKNLIDDIIGDDDTNSVRTYISLCIEYFLETSGKGFEYIPRGDFISYMKSAYASNTENQKMIRVKDYLDVWLQEHMTIVGRSNYGKTAKQSYRKALYMFFIFIINYIAKV